ncbi:MAG: hypothetical protein ACYC8T_28090, partial [Myxococcaceae bacterium]
ECVQCLDDTHCFSVAPKCDLLQDLCVGCLANADCANPTPVCAPVQQCLPCNTAAECGAGRSCDALGRCNPLPDACGTEGVLTFSGGLGTVSFSAEPALAIDDTSGTCNAAGGPELVYRFTTSAVRDLSVTVARLAGSQAQPVVYLRGPSCTAGPQPGCDASTTGAASLSLSNLAAGTWFLFVESAGGAPGRVAVNVTLLAPAQPPTNDSCTFPQALVFGGVTAAAVGNTALATNDSSGAANDPSCSATARTTGKDLVYSYTLAVKSKVTVVARPVTGSPLHPVLSVRSACGTPTTELGCAASLAGEPVTLSFPSQAAGTYYLWLDSADGTANAFQLEVTALPVVDNDACAAPQALTFSGNTATATGDNTYATNGNGAADPTPSCSPTARGTGRDVVYSYTLAASRDVTVSVVPVGAAPSYQPVVYVRRGGCANTLTAGEAGCVNPASSGPATLTLRNQPAGTYHVWVDASQDTAGAFQLEVVQSAPTPPPANDSCTSPQLLTFVSGQATATGSTLQAANDNSSFDVSPTCSDSAKQNGRDVVYTFTLPGTRDVGITVAPAAGSALHPALYVRKSSCTSQLYGDELVCLQQVGPVTAMLTSLPAGTYYLWVDGAGGTAGDFSLQVTLTTPTPAPPNDDCAGATALSFTGSVATATGTTFGASNSNSPNELSPGCGDNWLPKRYGRDLVYTYQLGTAQDVDIVVTPGPGSLLVPVLYLRQNAFCTSGSAGYELACLAAKSPVGTSLYLPNQPAGTYALFVDSNTYDTGAFTLTVTRKAPTLPPAYDSCAAPSAVVLGVTGVTGNTTGARNDYSSSTSPNYSTACNRYPFDGRDTAHRFTAAATGTVTATLTPQGLFDPALLLLAPACGPSSCLRFSDSAGAGAAESMTLSVVSGQSYFFIVDSYDASQPNTWGGYTLTVQ